MSARWRAEYEVRRSQREGPAREDLVAACALLARLGVRTAAVRYAGADGAGSLSEVRVVPPLPGGGPEGLAGVLRSASYWLLPPGWELGAGSSGTLSIDVRTMKVSRAHRRRVVRTERRTDEFELESHDPEAGEGGTS